MHSDAPCPREILSARMYVCVCRGRNTDAQAHREPGYANTPETRWYYVLYVLKFILYNTAMYYLSVQ